VREERLLERIGTWEKNPTRREKEDPVRITESVLEHLKRILNTKQGSVMIAEDYGLPELSDLVRSAPDSIRDIEKSIKLMIQKYEPRLKMVRVSFDHQEEDVLELRFQISAVLSSESKKKVYFSTIINTEGMVKIKS
jgi:type VI secretion system protein